MDGDGTFILLMAQTFSQDYQYDAFGRMTSATSPLWANPRLLRIHPLWKGGWSGGGADGGLFYPAYDANGQQKSAKGKVPRRPTAILRLARKSAGARARSGIPRHSGNCHITEYVDTNGVVVAHYAYDAFGNLTPNSSFLIPTSPDFRFRFSTKYLDVETGLYNYGLRPYSPKLQRFISRDPIEEQGGLNLYGFCGNDPINKWDYLGLYGVVKIVSDAGGIKYGIQVGRTAWIEHTTYCDRKIDVGNTKVTLKKGTKYFLHTYGHRGGPQREPNGQGRLGLNTTTNYNDNASTHTRTAFIDDTAEEALWKYAKTQRDLGADAWSVLKNCTVFASEAWQVATGEYLDPSNGKTVGNDIPSDKLLGFSKEVGVKEEFIPLVALGAKKIPLNTPYNLAQSIYRANGNQENGSKK